jgi:hypothetical protein
MITFRIEKMIQNEFDKQFNSHPNALYSWSISVLGSSWIVSSGMLYDSVKLLMDYFNVDDPSELSGKTFDMPDDYSDPSSALDLLLKKIQHGGNYNPPSSEQLISRAINSLATMTCPDFSDVDGKTVYETFQETFHCFSPKAEWLNWFKEQISLRSSGEVQVKEGNPENFNSRVKGPAAYLMLVKRNQEIKVIFGPYSTPFSYCE